MTTTYRDGWANIDATAAPHEYVATMSRIRDAQPADQFAAFLGLLDVQPGQQILDVACGQGHVAQVVARHIGAGRVIGVDRSLAMVEEARRRAADLSAILDFQQADASALPFADNTFDRAYTLSSLEHFAQPQQALEELVRTVRPEGQVYIADYDYRTMMIDTDTPELTKQLMTYFAEVDTNSEFVFTVPRRLGDLGMRVIHVTAEVELVHQETFNAEPDFAYGFYRDLWLGPLVADAEAAGVVAPEEARRWLAEQDERARAGRFYLSVVKYRVTAIKPSPEA
jgi:SAM-dependent methyltransferase